MRAIPALIAIAAALAGCGGGASDPRTQIATLERYCVDCHNDVDLTADVSFEAMSAASIGEHVEDYEKAVRKLRSRVMPPPGEPRPENENVDALVAWLEAELDAIDSTAHIDATVVLHRLTRTQSANAVRDLLAIDVVAAAVLPDDEIAGGYDNIASALQVSPS
jgi:hypothetical protein